MNTIDHGTWTRYTPDPPPEGVPVNTMFARRDSDGMDWYVYAHAGDSFGAGNVVIAAYWVDGQNSYVVGPATQNPTAIFPQNCIVHEITDYAGSDPAADLSDKCFDPATGTVSDLAPPPAQIRVADDPVMQALASIQNRLDALENK